MEARSTYFTPMNLFGRYYQQKIPQILTSRNSSSQKFKKHIEKDL